MIVDNTNPGEKLYSFLKQLFPEKHESLDSDNLYCFISRMDDCLIADGEFIKIVYNSSINYILRRLVNTAEYLKRKYETDEFPAGKFVEELRKFIKQETRIPDNESEKIIVLLQACIQSKGKELKTSRKKRLIKEYKSKSQLRCYICGKDLNEEEVKIEHMWPKTMGGATEEFNLKISCSDCNDKKKDYINSSDFHYEQICLVTDKEDKSFSNEMKKEYRIALWAKSDYSCMRCGKPASIVGKLNFGRINLEDS